MIDHKQHKSSSHEPKETHKIGQLLEVACIPTSATIQESDQRHSRESNPYDFHNLYPSGSEPDHTKKEYCTYWIKTGECAWLSISCKYKHEMSEKKNLKELGFNQEPRWWKGKARIDIRGLTRLQHHLANPNDQLDEEPSVPALDLTKHFGYRKMMSKEIELPVVRAVPAATSKELQSKVGIMTSQQIMPSCRPTPPVHAVVPNMIDLEDVCSATSTSLTTLSSMAADH